MAERKGQVFDDFSGRLSCNCDGFGESESKKPEHTFLQISRQQFGVDSLIILKFIALAWRWSVFLVASLEFFSSG